MLEISWGAVSERPPVNNFSMELSTPLVLRFCLSEKGTTVFVGSWADVCTAVKALVSLLTYDKIP